MNTFTKYIIQQYFSSTNYKVIDENGNSYISKKLYFINATIRFPSLDKWRRNWHLFLLFNNNNRKTVIFNDVYKEESFVINVLRDFKYQSTQGSGIQIKKIVYLISTHNFTYNLLVF